MLAARYYGVRDIRIEEVSTPRLVAADDVLISVHYCGICGTDLHEYTDGPIVTCVEPHPVTGATLPQTLGHEFSATVVEVGSSVTEVRVGDRVAVMPAIVCHTCYYCRRGLGHLCLRFAATGLSAETGGMADLAVVKDYQLAILPDEVSNIEGALIEPAAVAAYGVERAGLVGGDVVLVIGAGPIGILTAMYASAAGASTVIIAEPNENRAHLARGLDIGHVMNPASDEFSAMLEETTRGIGVDLSVECSGTSPGLATCLTNTRRRGSIVQTGLHTKTATLDAMALCEKDIALFGSWCYHITDWPRVIRLVASGKYPVSKVVTEVIPLADVVTQGFDVLVNPKGDQLKILMGTEKT